MRKKDYITEGERNTGWLYLITPRCFSYNKDTKKIPFKVGRTFHPPEVRLMNLQTSNFLRLVIDSQYGIMIDVRFNERTVLNFIKYEIKAERCAGKEWFLLTKPQYIKVKKLMSNIQENYNLGSGNSRW